MGLSQGYETFAFVCLAKYCFHEQRVKAGSQLLSASNWAPIPSLEWGRGETVALRAKIHSEREGVTVPLKRSSGAL